MRFKSLKTGIFINLAFLLFFAIALTDLVLLQITEQRMIEDRLETARNRIMDVHRDSHSDVAANSSFGKPSKESLISASLISFKGEKPELVGELPNFLAEDILSFHEAGVGRKNSRLKLAGTIWGVFWPRSRYAILSEPLSGTDGAVTAVVPLGPVYRSMRDVQHMALFYLVINLFLLLAVGGFRLSKRLTKPIDRLIRITDEYRTSEGFDMFSERQDGEFSRLSGALNQMVRRIEEDREQLRSSLESLEQTNLQLKAAQKEIVRAEKLASTGRLSAGLAHEIGNPIGIVLGYLGLLKTRSISPDDRVAIDYIERAESEIQRVNTIIQQLLDFSRSRPSDYSVLSIHELLKYAVEMLSQQPLFSGIRIRTQLEAENDRIYGDSDQIYQVMVNLMINAADSIKQSENEGNGIITIITGIEDHYNKDHRYEQAGKWIELKVIDNGSGIDEEHTDKIFDPFFTTKEIGKGTGLGLSVSYMIIEQMGGGIDLRLPENGGAEIIISLPVAEKSFNEKGTSGKNTLNGKDL